MKKWIVIIFAVQVVFIYFGCGKGQSARTYYKNIFEQEQKVTKATQDFSIALEKGMAEAENIQKNLPIIEKSYQELGNTLQSAINTIKNTKGIKNDEGFKESAVALFEFYQKVHKEEYKTLVELCKKGKFNDEELQQMSLITESIDKNGKPFEDKLKGAKAKFVQKYDL
jgi:hypothetical protein